MNYKHNYAEQRNNPRWLALKSAVLMIDDHTCQICGQRGGRLEVHHTHYDSLRAYWEYSSEELITLCRKCHEFITNSKRRITREYIRGIKDNGMRVPKNQQEEDLF